MSDSLDPRQEWITRVLGVVLADRLPGLDLGRSETDDDAWAGAEDDEAADGPTDPQDIYEDAKQRVADGINALGKLLMLEENPLGHRIAEYGLLSLTDGEHVALTKSLLGYRMASGDARAGAAAEVRKAVDSFRARLKQPVFARLDANPLGIEIGWTTTLDQALGRIALVVE